MRIFLGKETAGNKKTLGPQKKCNSIVPCFSSAIREESVIHGYWDDLPAFAEAKNLPDDGIRK